MSAAADLVRLVPRGKLREQALRELGLANG